jgi:hypothetical protein
VIRHSLRRISKEDLARVLPLIFPSIVTVLTVSVLCSRANNASESWDSGDQISGRRPERRIQ